MMINRKSRRRFSGAVSLILAMCLALAGCGGGKLLHVGNGTGYSVDFTINRIYIPQK